MGYTHYWDHPMIDAEKWDKIVEDAKKLVAASPVKLAHDCDEPETPPHVGNENIWFNGVGDDGHETFVLTRKGTDFDFCKTAQKPYDLIVVAILAVAAAHGVSVRADGDAPDWKDGLEYASRILGRPVALPSEIRNPEKEEGEAVF